MIDDLIAISAKYTIKAPLVPYSPRSRQFDSLVLMWNLFFQNSLILSIKIFRNHKEYIYTPAQFLKYHGPSTPESNYTFSATLQIILLAKNRESLLKWEAERWIL